MLYTIRSGAFRVGEKKTASRLVEIFKDKKLVNKIQSRLPRLFQLAELDASRAKKVGMEVGSIREKILVALLIYKFGEGAVETEIPITESEIDLHLSGQPLSIKTITGMGGVKIIWTVDPHKAREFKEAYFPSCDILLAQIKWGGGGGLYYIPLEVQCKVFDDIGRENYIKLPKPGTNPRGVEFSKDTLLRFLNHGETKSIQITWQRSELKYNPYQRWVDYWRES